MPGSSSVPRIKRLFSGNPIVTKQESHPWESRVTFNPACAFVEDRDELSLLIPSLPFGAAIRKRLQEQPGLCFLLYRAQGEKTPSYDHTRSSVGLAVLSPELELLARHEEPVLLPDHAYDNLGVEDGRITKVGKRYVMIYTAYGTGERDNRIRIAAASTTDFVHWEKLGLLQGDFNEINNKNAMLFPGSVDGTMVMLHRPMEGENAMAIHWAEAHELMGPWRSRGMLMAPRPNPAFKDTWIGGGAPPIPLDHGRYLILYHMGNRKTDGTREYDLGIAVCDPR